MFNFPIETVNQFEFLPIHRKIDKRPFLFSIEDLKIQTKIANQKKTLNIVNFSTSKFVSNKNGKTPKKKKSM